MNVWFFINKRQPLLNAHVLAITIAALHCLSSPLRSWNYLFIYILLRMLHLCNFTRGRGLKERKKEMFRHIL